MRSRTQGVGELLQLARDLERLGMHANVLRRAAGWSLAWLSASQAIRLVSPLGPASGFFLHDVSRPFPHQRC